MNQSVNLGHWQELYLAALAETDRVKLFGRIDLAEEAIHERLRELSLIPYPAEALIDEKQKIDGALVVLRVLLRDAA